MPNLWTGSSAFADTVSNNATVGGNDTVNVGSTTSVSYTKGFSDGTYQLRVDLGDGIPHTVNITSKK